MSKETSKWLNTQTLIGMTAKRGNAWHYRAEDQGDEPNHYPGFVPTDDVLRRLFNFVVNEVPLYVAQADGTYAEVPGRKAMQTSDTNEVLGIFKGGYQGHSYRMWLLETVATIIGDELGIVSAGLLRNRAQAWVQVSVPETVTTKDGFAFLPYIQASTSFDGSLATTFGIGENAIVCDNTLHGANKFAAGGMKVKHTKYSGFRIENAKEALGILATATDAITEELEALAATVVTDAQFGKVLDLLVPIPEDSSNKRGVTVAEDKRQQISALYKHDDRSAPWQGSALGVLQAFNTYAHHYAQVRGDVHRGQRNMENAVNGKFATLDSQVLATVASVTQ